MLELHQKILAPVVVVAVKAMVEVTDIRFTSRSRRGGHLAHRRVQPNICLVMTYTATRLLAGRAAELQPTTGRRA